MIDGLALLELSPTAASALAVLVALGVDRAWGEPVARWHPVVWMGAYLGRAGQRVAPPMGDGTAHRLAVFARGALAWLFGAAVVVAIAVGVVSLIDHASVGWQALWLGLLLKPLLAWRMLRDEVGAVAAALGESLTAGRARLAWLVSRDVAQLDAAQVRESAIETLAENLNDSVVAPLFWFAVAGLPGAALYRFANTADAMWGYQGVYKGQNWEWAGKWAARADDVLSWLPARVTALLLVLVSPARWTAVCREAVKTPSPNSGWPMATMALALDIRLGKPGVYVLNPAARQPTQMDTARAIMYAEKVIVVFAFMTLTALVLRSVVLP